LTSIADDIPLAGPLAAMATGWKALTETGYPGAVIVLACDVPIVAGRPQPLCARYSAGSLDTCRHLVADGQRSLNALLYARAVTWIGKEVWSVVSDEICFFDIDTPAHLARIAGFDPRRFER
jgi:molybdopterin-guanine dinucleotide biosynthesis protein A